MVVLLVETADGNIVGVRFKSTDEAYDWADSHEAEIDERGCVQLATRREALDRSHRG